MAATKIFINTSAKDPTEALVESFFSTQRAATPAFTRDDLRQVEIHLLEEVFGNVDRPFRYLDPEEYFAVRVGAGVLDATPTGGTFTLTFSLGVTAAIPFDATALQVRTAVQAVSGMGSATVTGNDGGPWTIDRVTTGTYDAPVGDDTALTPFGSTVQVLLLDAGSPGVRSAKWQVTLVKALAIYRGSGWSSLTAAFVNPSVHQAGSATAPKKNKIFRIEYNADAIGGTISLTFTGPTTAGTVSFAYDATVEDIEAAFATHPDVGDEGVKAFKDSPGEILIECVGATIKELDTPALTASSNTLEVPMGLSGTLGCNTLTFISDLAGQTEETVNFEVEIQRIEGLVETVVRRDDCLFSADLLRNTSGQGIPLEYGEVRTGTYAVTVGQEYVDVVFTTPHSGSSWNFRCGPVPQSAVHPPPEVLFCGSVSNKTTTGFRVYLSAAPTNANHDIFYTTVL